MAKRRRRRLSVVAIVALGLVAGAAPLVLPNLTRDASATTTVALDDEDCTATYQVVSQWRGGFRATVTVTAEVDIDDWQVSWTFPNGQRIRDSWDADITTSRSHVVAEPETDEDGELDEGDSTTFGFIGSFRGRNRIPQLECIAP